MEHLNVEGLPEPIVRGLEVIVEMARKGTVYGTLTRKEIYDDLA
jgi:hypothetical protein